MKLLADQSAGRVAELVTEFEWVGGQLLTPITAYRAWDGAFAIDNGAYSSCDVEAYVVFVKRQLPHRERCLWVAVPDVVGSARRTLEVFGQLAFRFHGWPLALVCQDGQEDLPIPWDAIQAVFIGGSTEWKMSPAAGHIVKAAQLLGKRTHIGRVNTPTRYAHFLKLGADTCDGSGASKYDHMIDAIANSLKPRPLLEDGCASG